MNDDRVVALHDGAAAKRALRNGPPISYPDNAVLTLEQVAGWLDVSPRHVEACGIPFFKLGRLKRYLAGSVIAWMKEQQQHG